MQGLTDLYYMYNQLELLSKGTQNRRSGEHRRARGTETIPAEEVRKLSVIF